MTPSEKDLETNLNAIDNVRDLAKAILNLAYCRSKNGTGEYSAVIPEDLIESGRLAEIADRTHKVLSDLQKAVQKYGPYSLE
jgi:hypothetical protein